MAYDVEKTDEEWRAELSPEEYAVLRQAGTERAFIGEYTDTETKGIYRCKACERRAVRVRHQVPLRLRLAVASTSRSRDTIEYIEDTSHGHEARRGALRQLRLAPRARLPRRLRHATGDRYCINSISIDLKPASTD